MLEIGNDPTDIQSTIISFDGTLGEHINSSVGHIKTSDKLEFVDVKTAHDGSGVIDYIWKSNGKKVKCYVFVPERLVNNEENIANKI